MTASLLKMRCVYNFLIIPDEYRTGAQNVRVCESWCLPILWFKPRELTF